MTLGHENSAVHRHDPRAASVVRLRALAGLLEAGHVGPDAAQQEDLHGYVVLEVRLAQERANFASGRLLDDRRELVLAVQAHDLIRDLRS